MSYQKIRQTTVNKSFKFYMSRRGIKASILPFPKFNLKHYSVTCLNLKIYCVYILCFFEKNSQKLSVYIGKTRMEPSHRIYKFFYDKPYSFGHDIKPPESFCIPYMSMNSKDAKDVEKHLIYIFRECKKWNVINKSEGGETGISLKTAFYDDVLKDYTWNLYHCFNECKLLGVEVKDVKIKIQELSNFKTMSDCINDVADEWEDRHSRWTSWYNKNLSAQMLDVLEYAIGDCRFSHPSGKTHYDP